MRINNKHKSFRNESSTRYAVLHPLGKKVRHVLAPSSRLLNWPFQDAKSATGAVQPLKGSFDLVPSDAAPQSQTERSHRIK